MMKNDLLYFAIAGFFVAMSSPSIATIGCEIVSSPGSDLDANLYAEPNDQAEVLAQVPAGDIVFYPAQDLAPVQAENWVWVQYDATQDVIWNEGILGWMKPENVSDFCG